MFCFFSSFPKADAETPIKVTKVKSEHSSEERRRLTNKSQVPMSPPIFSSNSSSGRVYSSPRLGQRLEESVRVGVESEYNVLQTTCFFLLLLLPIRTRNIFIDPSSFFLIKMVLFSFFVQPNVSGSKYASYRRRGRYE